MQNQNQVDGADQKRAEHEAAEAARKTAWEAKQAEKKAIADKVMEDVLSMSDEDVAAASVKRLDTDVERLTRRNMKLCVTEFLQTLCLSNPNFARIAMHPRKTIVKCFKYINRHALEYLKEEMNANGQNHDANMIGGDVPDDLCYKWAEAYFVDADAEEDKEKEDVFVPRPYHGAASKTRQKGSSKTPQTKPEAQLNLDFGAGG